MDDQLRIIKASGEGARTRPPQGGKCARRCPGCGVSLGPRQDVCGRCAHMPVGAAHAMVSASPHDMPPYASEPADLPFFRAGCSEPRSRAASARRRSVGVVLALLAMAAMAAAWSVWARWAVARNPEIVMLFLGHGLQQRPAPVVSSSQINGRLLASPAAVGADVEVCLAWNSLSDLDLEVRDPSGALIWARQPRSRSGGVQDVDANPTVAVRNGVRVLDPAPADVLPLTDRMVADGKAGGPQSHYAVLGREEQARAIFTRKPVEHVQFAEAPTGVYTVYAHCYWWREANRSPLPFSVEIRSRGKVVQEVSGLLGPENYVADRIGPKVVCQFRIG